MIDFKYPLKDFIRQGLAPNNNKRNKPMLTQSIGALPYNKQLQAIETFTRIDTSSLSGVTFPYPQLFITSEFVIVCTEDSIYEYDGSLTLKYGPVTIGSLWSLVDFKTYILLTNGAVTIRRSSTDGIYSPVETLSGWGNGEWGGFGWGGEGTIIGINYADSLCNYNGQLLAGSPDGYQGQYTRRDSSFTTTYTPGCLVQGEGGASVENVMVAYIESVTADLRFAKADTSIHAWTDVLVDSGTDAGSQPYLAKVDADNLFIAYRNASDRVRVASSTDGGATWTVNIVDDTDIAEENIAIFALDASNIYLIYAEGSFNRDLTFAKSSDGGSTWTVSLITSNSFGYMEMDIYAFNTSDIYIVYINELSTTQRNMYFRKTNNGGTTWINPSGTFIDGIRDTSCNMYVTNDKTIYIEYVSVSGTNRIKVAKTIDQGVSWSKHIVVDLGFSAIQPMFKSVYTPSDSFITAQYATTGGIFSAKSTDDGVSYTTTNVDTFVPPEGIYSYWLDDDTIFISYAGAASELFYSKSTDGGTSWTTTSVNGVLASKNSIASYVI